MRLAYLAVLLCGKEESQFTTTHHCSLIAEEEKHFLAENNKARGRKLFPAVFVIANQGQARGYGRITHKRGRTTGGHYFQDLFTAKLLDIHHFLGYQMKDLVIVFPRIPHNPL